MKERCSFIQNDDIISRHQLSMGACCMSEAVCRRLALCKPDEVDPGSAIKVEKEGFELAVFNLDGEFHVTDDACTHGPGSLSEGCIEGDEVECDFHNGRFNIKTGEVTAPPCMVPVKTYRTVIDSEGFVSIEF
jgi:nitrite reductase/ring-hydroxylating ferredoxin subunit